MLAPLKETLRTANIYLASSSEARKEVLRNMGLEEIIKCENSGAKEDIRKEDCETSDEYAVMTALQKVSCLESKLNKDNVAWDVIIGADTVVDIDGKILGKPKNEEEGREHLRSLSERMNTVVTGIAIKRNGSEAETFVEKTTVLFGKLTEEQIQEYASTPESQRCAGAYAIQGGAGTFVKKIDGNFFSIMGLPVYNICSRLYDMYKPETVNPK